MKESTEFTTVQKCTQPFIWILVIGLTLFMWYSVYQQMILGIPFGSNPAPDPVLIIIWIVVGILFPVALFTMKLIIKMDSKKFYYRLFPLHLRMHEYQLDNIESMEPVTIRPILDFGGWGIRWGRKGKGYLISGKRAVKVEFNAGRPIFFSSNEPEKIVEAYRGVQNSSLNGGKVK